jgi:altronate dehydratase large subunit
VSASDFEGGARGDGRTVGVRDRVLVLPSVICSHVVAERIAERVDGAVAAPHDHGCGQIGADAEQTRRTFLGLGENPNVAGVVVVGLGCETVQSDDVAAGLDERGVPVRELSIQGVGGTEACVERGAELARNLVDERSTVRRRAGPGDLTVGVVASDADDTSLGAAEPLVGDVVREVTAAGGRALVAGVERVVPHGEAIAERAASPAVAERIADLAAAHRDRPGRATRVRREAAERDPESLIRAWGGLDVRAVVEYGAPAPHESGLALVDAPSRFEEAATGLAAAGAQIVVHVTADGVPTGHPVVPVVKVTGDPETAAALPEDVDLDAGEADANDLADMLVDVARGTPSAAETHGLTSFALTRVGPSQ